MSALLPLLVPQLKTVDPSASVSYDVRINFVAMSTLDSVRTRCMLAIVSHLGTDINTLADLSCHTHVLDNGNTICKCVFAFMLKMTCLILTGRRGIYLLSNMDLF